MRSIAGVVAAVVVSGAVLIPAGPQTMRLGEVLLMHAPVLKPGTDTTAFESFVHRELVQPSGTATGRGAGPHLLRADRGSRKGQYLIVWTMPAAGRAQSRAMKSGSPASPDLQATRAGDRSRLEPFSTSGSDAEYHLIGHDRVGQLPEVEILGIHYTKVRPDRREAFEAFVREKVHPAVGQLRPDLRLLYYRPVEPDDQDYLAVFALTVASRDKYWPGGSDSDELRAAFGPAARKVADEMRPYLVEGTYASDRTLAAAVYESREWTDFVLVAPR